MGDSRKRIAEDEEDYADNCKHYGVKPEGGPYGSHAHLLERLRSKERDLHHEHRKQLKTRTEAVSKLTTEELKALGVRK